MWTLAIESSARTAAVALQQGDDPPVERRIADVGRRHAQTLVSEIELLFRDCSAKPLDCNLIAVSIGPGSFTGLRVGVVAAKTLAYAAECRLVAVDTFESISANSPADVSDVQVIADAQRGGLFAGRYCREQEQWRLSGAIEIVDAEAWARSLTERDVVSGSGVEKVRSLLPDSTKVLPPECWTPSAGNVAHIGRRLAKEGRFADCFTLEPFYLRMSAAEEKAAQGA